MLDPPPNREFGSIIKLAHMYEDISSTDGRNAFKKTEKEIKSRSHLVFKEDDVIDIQRASDFPGVVDNGSMMFRGEEKKVYGFEAMPDLLIVANVLPTWMQVEATHFALSSCPQFPNGTNLGPNQVFVTFCIFYIVTDLS